MEIEWDIYGDILSDKKNNCYHKPPSKSIVDAWYEKIGYRFLGGGPIALQCFVQIKH